MAKDTGRVAVFRVTRVWKGKIGQTFEMPAIEETAACWGFWPTFLKIGNDLVVYAFHFPGKNSGYVTHVCSRTKLAIDAKDDRLGLGTGKEPSRSKD